MSKENDSLKMSNQLCFPLYAASKEVVRKYKPFLDPLGLTYTQYITMMVMWEHKTLNVKEIGRYLFLDSGTLTPVLKKLEEKGYVVRSRSKDDERNLDVSITEEGEALRLAAEDLPEKLSSSIDFSSEDAAQLYSLLYKLLDSLSN